MKRNFKRLLSLFIVLVVISSIFTTVNALDHEYAITYVYEDYARGAKGDFKLPYINSYWHSSSRPSNFIVLTEWLAVNGDTGDWFELGYMDGALDPENDGINIDYRGFYKAKKINGAYWEDNLSKTATVGTRYTFSIVDYTKNNYWEIYIGSTYFGSFSSNVGPSYDNSIDFGYEITVDSYTNPAVSSTDITNLKYRNSSYTWKPIWNFNYVTTLDTSPDVNVSYSATYNKATFTEQ